VKERDEVGWKHNPNPSSPAPSRGHTCKLSLHPPSSHLLTLLLSGLHAHARARPPETKQDNKKASQAQKKKQMGTKERKKHTPQRPLHNNNKTPETLTLPFLSLSILPRPRPQHQPSRTRCVVPSRLSVSDGQRAGRASSAAAPAAQKRKNGRLAFFGPAASRLSPSPSTPGRGRHFQHHSRRAGGGRGLLLRFFFPGRGAWWADGGGVVRGGGGRGGERGTSERSERLWVGWVVAVARAVAPPARRRARANVRRSGARPGRVRARPPPLPRPGRGRASRTHAGRGKTGCGAGRQGGGRGAAPARGAACVGRRGRSGARPGRRRPSQPPLPRPGRGRASRAHAGRGKRVGHGRQGGARKA
jgi:hypothetical protein